MAKPAPYTLRWSHARQLYELVESENTTVLDLQTGSLAWLQEVPSFAFAGQRGAYTARKETKQRGQGYWYAYRKRGGKLTKAYLGKVPQLTLARLEEVAHLLSAEPAAEASVSEASFQPSGKEAHAVLDTQEGKLVGDAEPHTPQARLPERELDPLLATRLQRPRLRPQLVQRSPLTERLTQALAGALTLVSAPAGWGKTTALCDWLTSSGTPAAWLSLEPEDNEPVRFLSSVIAALQTLDPAIGGSALALLHTPQPAELRAVLVLLTNELLARRAASFALVLDDYHVITAGPIHQALNYLVEHLPEPMHLVIATRADPPLPLARLRARGQVTEVRAADLRFTTQEAETFLHTTMGLSLSSDEVAVLQNRTEGWIAGLQLAALSLRGRSDSSAFLRAFGGSHRFVLEYLSEEVLSRQSVAVQTFLLQTSLLERLSGPLCDALTGEAHGQRMLEALERANLFVSSLDDQRQWYRYHHLFADMLRSRLQQTQPSLVPALHRRASTWYEHHGMVIEAVRHALAAPDVEQAARLVEQHGLV